MIDKMANVYKKTFPVRWKRVYGFVVGELQLVFNWAKDVYINIFSRL